MVLLCKKIIIFNFIGDQDSNSDFDIVSEGDTMGFPYDFNSLMHYTEHELTVNGERTIVPKKPGFIIPNNLKNFLITR